MITYIILLYIYIYIPATYITGIDYSDDIAITTDTLKDAKTLLHKIEEIANNIGLKVNIDKTEYMSYNLNNDINIIYIIYQLYWINKKRYKNRRAQTW